MLFLLLLRGSKQESVRNIWIDLLLTQLQEQFVFIIRLLDFNVTWNVLLKNFQEINRKNKNNMLWIC